LAEEKENNEGSVKKTPVLLIILFSLVILLLILVISMYVSYVIADSTARKAVTEEKIVFEEDGLSLGGIVQLASPLKDGSFMVYIKSGADQASLSCQIQFHLAISKPDLRALLEDKDRVAPIVDRLLAYFSEKTRTDILYGFQKKILGEEIKEIINSILERDLQLPPQGGRITRVHITRLLFMPV
jgi:flagellar basal body-associated protein FliL